ncbi:MULTISPECIES: DUF6527 family protein [unclassified Rhizobium]
MSKATDIVAVLVDADEGHRYEAINATPGAFFWFTEEGEDQEGGIFASCPCGCQKPIKLPTVVTEKNRIVWENDGSREQPSLKPSIGIYPWQGEIDKEADGYHWHGFLADGVWVSQ